jgi:hypothetical protein
MIDPTLTQAFVAYQSGKAAAWEAYKAASQAATRAPWASRAQTEAAKAAACQGYDTACAQAREAWETEVRQLITSLPAGPRRRWTQKLLTWD